MHRLSLIVVASCLLAFAGCEQKAATPPGGTDSTSTAKPPGSAGESDHGHEHPAPAPAPKNDGDGAGHGGAIIELGTATIGDFTVRASRDQGEIQAGGDAPIDVWLTTADGKPATVTAVRFWIGTEDAKGCVKAKADIEDPTQPNHWHTHAEVPNPMPGGSSLWVEIEASNGKTVGSFDLKQ